MSAEDELRQTVERVKRQQAQQQADATEETQAKKYKATTDAAAIEKFVRDILPGVVEPLLPMVGTMARRPVHAVGGAPGNQSHGDHHDWHYAFEVGSAEAIVDSCGTRLEVYVNGGPYEYEDELTEAGASRFFNTVVELGLRGKG